MRKVLLLLAVVAGMLAFSAQDASAQASNDPADVEAAIYANFAPEDVPAALAVAGCETTMGADIVNEGSYALGAFQFIPSTSAALGLDHEAHRDPYYNAWAAARYVAIAGWTPWAASSHCHGVY